MRHRRLFGAVIFAALTIGVAACGGGGGGITPHTPATPTPKPTPAAQQQQPVTATSGGTVSAALPGGGSLSVQVPANSLSGNATVTIYAYTSLAQLSSAKIIRRGQTASASVPSGGVFLGGFAIDTGSAIVLKPMQITETLQASVPAGDVLRVARLGSSGYTDVDTATASGSNATNDLNSKYVSVSGGGTAAPYMIYAVPQASAATPAPIVITGTAAANQQVVIGGTGSFTVSGADKNGNPLPWVPAFDTDNHAIATAVAGATPFTANVTATAQGGVLNLLSTDARTGVTGKTAFTVYTQRPANAGNTFAFSGTMHQTQTFAYPQPTLPPTDVTANVTQSVTVSATANPLGGTGTVQDFNAVETDAYPTQTFKTTTDYYYNLAYGGDFDLLGYNATDDQGNTTSVDYVNPQIVDELPETSGASWSNSPAMLLKQNFAGLEKATRTVDGDGAYTDYEDIYQGTGDGTTYPAMEIVLSDAADGSGSLAFTYNYTGTPYNPPYTSQTFTWSVSAPHVPSPAPSATPGPPVVDIYESRSIVQATPAPSPSPVYQFSLKQWYTLPLYAETDKNLGSVTIPQACNVPSGFGTTAMQIEQKVNRLDTALGSVETTTTDSYIVTGFGPVCVQVSDNTQAFYDFNNDTGYNWYYNQTPMQVSNVSETLTLQSQGTSTTPQLRRTTSSQPLQPLSAGAIGIARQHVHLIAERNRLLRVRGMARRMFKAILKGGVH